MSNGLDFGQARAHVVAELGGEAVGDESRLELIMQAALVEIANELSINREQRVIIPFTLAADAATYTLPGDCSRVVEVRAEGRVIPRLPPNRDITITTNLDVNQWPSFWWVDNDPVQVLHFEPAPADDLPLYVEYVSVVDIDLFDPAGAAEDDRVWRPIPLPVEIHPAFVQYVVGRAMVKIDPGVAATISNTALGEIMRWKTQRAKDRQPRLVLNRDSFRNFTGRRSIDRWENDAAQFRPIYD